MPVSGAPIHQSFLPTNGQSRAFVWKYTPVNWGRRPRHFHIEPEFNLIASGRAVFGVGDTVVEARAHDLLLFPAGQDHVLLEASPDLYLYAIGMDPVFSAEVVRTHGPLPGPRHIRLPDEDFHRLLLRASDSVDRYGAEGACAELWTQAHWIGQKRDRGVSAPMHVLTRRALTMLVDDPGITLECVADRLHAPPSEVSRSFHHDMGTTFVTYRTRLRVLNFIRTVDRGGLNLSAIAEESGFGSYSQCHRVFEATFGTSPRAFFHAGVRERMQQAYDP